MWSYLPHPGSFGGSRDRQGPGTAHRNWPQLCKEFAGLGWKLQLKRRYLIQEGTGLYSLEGQCAPHNEGVLEGGGVR